MKNCAAIIPPPGCLDALVALAANSLQTYLERLFNVRVIISEDTAARAPYRFFIGLQSDPHIQRVAGTLPQLSEQGHVVRRIDANTLVLAGGNSQAVVWAVYELVERYGVRFLLHEDVFPDDSGKFYLPDLDALCEPVHQLRSWRQFCELPTGPALWSLGQQKAFINQIFKLKFNGVFLSLWPLQPFVNYEVRGIRRHSTAMLFGQQIPINSDNIGREHLPDMKYLANPELPETGEDLICAGQRLIRGILEHAKSLGMHTTIDFQPMEFPLEFRPLLENPTGKDELLQINDLTCAERGNLANDAHQELVEAKFNSYLEQYKNVDELLLGLPEFPHAHRTFQQCWDELDRKHHVKEYLRVEEVIDSFDRSYFELSQIEQTKRGFMSTVVMLQFFDDFFSRTNILKRASEQKARVGLCAASTSMELFPILDRVLWEGATFSTPGGYTGSEAIRNMHYMERLDTDKIPSSLILTLQDDNIGSLPQIGTGNIHVLMSEMARLNWRGYSTRYWPIGDIDPTVAFLAKASWDSSATPKYAYTDHFRHVYGEGAVDPLCQVMRILENVTAILEFDFASILFPVCGYMKRFANAKVPRVEYLPKVRGMYEQCRRILLRVRDLPVPSAGRANLEYWINRLTFAIEAVTECQLLDAGGKEISSGQSAAESSNENLSEVHIARAGELYQQAVVAGERAMRATAQDIRDDSDRATLAAYYHFLVREVRQETEKLLGSLSKQV